MSNELEQKQYKYEYRGQGFNNKHDLYEAMVLNQLSPEGRDELLKIYTPVTQKVCAKFPEKTPEQLRKMVFFGFRNTETQTIVQDLQECIDTLTTPGTVEVICYTHSGPTPYRQAGFILLRKHLTAEGLAIVGNKVLDSEDITVETGTLPVERQQTTEQNEADQSKSYGQVISTNPLD